VGLPDSPSDSSSAPDGAQPGSNASVRYALGSLLGQGGVASVHEAVDLATGHRIALKRLLPEADPRRRVRNEELFQREYHTLAQLAHPRIVEVHDYGIDAAGAFYTMELLDGGDLQQLAPLPWRTACSIARDVASALSLLHSRRLVHRDVSPRNVRRSTDGLAKLIDFGAIVPMGPTKLIVGTPPCCAPESVHLQPLDARTDLFSLGATLYFMLVGHHAYAARSFAQLSEAWQRGFAPPSELVEDIPEALDGLVTDLLRLEPDARPANAAELIARLSAIDGVAPIEQLRVAQAYLAMPTLVGRESTLARVHRKLKRATHSRGRTLLIEGDAGVGRSRLLDACVLDAALLGAICARADADDAVSGEYGVLRALGRQLLRVAPVAAEAAARAEAALLLQVIPELAASLSPRPTNAPEPVVSAARRPKLQAALSYWFKAVSQHVPLVLAIDDFHRIDEPSAAVLALLAHDAPHHLAIVVSVESGQSWISPPARKLLLEAATRISLGPLNRTDTEKLLQSLFGDVPNLGSLTHRIYDVAGGNPRDVLRLAQHLVERGIVRYAGGAWTVPAQIDQLELPNSMASALRVRVESLGPSARRLAFAFSLCPDRSFDFVECQRLDGVRDQGGALFSDLDELLNADILRRIDDRLRLAHPIWIAPVREVHVREHEGALHAELERTLHARLAAVLEAAGQEFRAGQHWLRAGEHGRALDVLVEHARHSQDETARDPEVFMHYAQSLPADWLETYERAFELCVELKRPERDAFYLRSRLAGIVPAFSADDKGQIAALLARLKQDSGLADWETLDAALSPSLRIERAIELAQARHASVPERERVLPPQAAMAVLARTVGSATSRVAAGLDVPYLRALPVLAPFAPISTSFGLLDKLMQGLEARYTGNSERAREIYQSVLERLAEPDLAGLDRSYAEITRLSVMNALGVMEACMGLASSLEWAQRTASHPGYLLNAVQTRMLYHLYQGNIHAADDCKRQAEKLRVQSLQLYESSHLVWEIGAYTIAEDLTRLRHAIEACVSLGQRFGPWLAVQHFAGAEYHRIRRDPGRALSGVETALALAEPGVHPLWANIATTRVRVLGDLGRHTEALAAAETYVELAQRTDIGSSADPLWLALAVCRVRVHDDNAEALVDDVIARYEVAGVSGLLLGAAHETRARIALTRGDDAMFDRHAEACRAAYCGHRNSALLAKYKRLVQDAERKRSPVGPRLHATPDSYSSYTGMRIVGALEFCRGAEERARLALTILVRQSGASGGFMFSLGATGPECLGAVGGMTLPDSITLRVGRYLAHHTEEAPTTSTDSQDEDASDAIDWQDEDGREFRPVLLSHNPGGGVAVTGLAVLVLGKAAEFRYPAEIAAAISRFYADAGDTSMMVMPE
jgi:hypothetical protein